MAVWKVLSVVLFGSICLALAFATIIIPLGMGPDEGRGAWLAGLLSATAVSGVLFALYLRAMDRAMAREPVRGRVRR